MVELKRVLKSVRKRFKLPKKYKQALKNIAVDLENQLDKKIEDLGELGEEARQQLKNIGREIYDEAKVFVEEKAKEAFVGAVTGALAGGAIGASAGGVGAIPGAIAGGSAGFTSAFLE